MITKRKFSLATILLFMIVAFSSLQVFAKEHIQLPRLGDHTIWECKGPWTHRYDVKVTDIRDRLITYKGSQDGKNYYIEKEIDYLGTTLWSQLGTNQHQRIDPYYFTNFSYLKPGTLVKGPVPIKAANDYWVWEYEIGVGSSKEIEHSILGAVRIVPVTETRTVYHGAYWTRMKSLIAPSLGITVSWTFSNPSGEETCKLTKFTRKKQ